MRAMRPHRAANFRGPQIFILLNFSTRVFHLLVNFSSLSADYFGHQNRAKSQCPGNDAYLFLLHSDDSLLYISIYGD